MKTRYLVVYPPCWFEVAGDYEDFLINSHLHQSWSKFEDPAMAARVYRHLSYLNTRLSRLLLAWPER